MISLEGKHYLVTGAASGIGLSTAIVLEGLDATVARCDIETLDLRKTERVPELLATSRGRFDGLVHCAGVPCTTRLRGLSPNAYRDAVLINQEAALALAMGFEQYGSRDGGSIVFISSVMGLVGAHGAAAYSMTKAALHGLARGLALELAPKKIRVNCVAPGFLNTPMTKRTLTPEQYEAVAKLHPLGLGEGSDVAHAVAFLLSDAARWITGTVLVVDGGYTAR